MLLSNLKKFHPLVLLLLPVTALFFWSESFFSISKYTLAIESQSFLFRKLWYVLTYNNLPLIPVIFGLFVLFVQTYIVIQLDIRFIITEKRSFLLSFIFLIFTCVLSENQNFVPALVGNLFLILSIYPILGFYKENNSISSAFNSALLISIGSLFYINIIYFFIIIWAGFLIFRAFYWREWTAALLGLITPYIFYAGLWFVFNNSLFEAWVIVKQNFLYHVSLSSFGIHYKIFGFTMLALTTLVSLRMISIYSTKNITIRKYFVFFLTFFLLSLFVFLIVPSASVEMLIISAFPLSFLFSTFFFSLKSKWLGEIIFIILILTALIIKFKTSLILDFTRLNFNFDWLI